MTDRKTQLKNIPGVSGLPYFGVLFDYLKDPIGLNSRLEKEHGNVYRFKFLGQDTITLLGEDVHKFLLLDQAENLSSKEAWELTLGDLFPNGLMLMDGDQHKYHRSIIREAFKKEPLNGYLGLMIPIINQVINDWEVDKQMMAFHEVKELTLKVAGKVFFGIDFSNYVSKVNQALMDLVKASLSIPINLWFTKFGKGLRARKYLVNFFEEMISDKRKTPTKDLFSILCHAKNENGDQLEDQEIIDHLIFILMAAHDTTASAITSWIYQMGKHPQLQQSIREEVQNTNLSTISDSRFFRDCDQLNLSIKETLRMHPPLITLPRKSLCPIDYKGSTIPENTTTMMMLVHTHHDEKIWTSPYKFDPDRFTKERSEHQKCPHAYAPFGAGSHHCVGYAFAEMEMQLIMSCLLQRFKWSFDEAYECTFLPVPINRPKDGLPVKFERL